MGQDVVFLPCEEALEINKIASANDVRVAGVDLHHFFHAECLINHLKDKKRCPVCLAPVKTFLFEKEDPVNFDVYR